MEQPIISVSGLRGIIGQSLFPSNASQYAACLASLLPPGPIVLTRDGRSTGPMLSAAVRSTLQALGRTVLDGDVAATPTTGSLIREHQAVGGIQISASHNPVEYNGLKLFNAEGRVISADFGQRVIEAMHSDTTNHESSWAPHDEVGQHQRLTDTVDGHLDRVAKTVDVDAIRAKRFRVLLDANHGAGSLLGKALLQHLGTTPTLVGDQPDGRFEHPPEPTATNLSPICELASKDSFDVTFCQDPDADRLAIIDENGSYIGEEYTLALTLLNRVRKNPGPVVINCSTSRMSLDIAEQHGCPWTLSAVGEANVCDEMKRVNAVYGGEGSGGPIDPQVGFVRDSFVAMAQILDLMTDTGKSISQLVDELPGYSIHKEKCELDRANLVPLYERVGHRFPEANASRLDGLRLDWPHRWLLIRPSNTEPIIRIICESSDCADAKETVEIVRKEIEQL